MIENHIKHFKGELKAALPRHLQTTLFQKHEGAVTTTAPFSFSLLLQLPRGQLPLGAIAQNCLSGSLPRQSLPEYVRTSCGEARRGPTLASNAIFNVALLADDRKWRGENGSARTANFVT